MYVFEVIDDTVVSLTVSGWIKNLLSLTGINTEKLKGYSTRSTSTSKATLSGLGEPGIQTRRKRVHFAKVL